MKRESSKIPRVPETVPKQSKTLKILGNGKVNGLKTLCVYKTLSCKQTKYFSIDLHLYLHTFLL